MSEAPGMHNPNVLPPGIPAPQDDGGARHLTGMTLPDLALPATAGAPVNLAKLKGRTVVYIYPRTGVPGVDAPAGLGRNPRRPRLHAAILRLPRPFRRAQAARRRAALRSVDAGHRLSARGGEPAASAVCDPVGRDAGADQSDEPADLLHVGHDAAQTHGARH